MDFIITKEQKRMKKAAREFLKSESPADFVREMEKDEKGYTDKIWRHMSQLDWMSLAIPEDHGGVGGDLIDLVLLLEEMGRACVPGPFFSTVVMGGFSISLYGSEDQKQKLLPAIANGEVLMTLAFAEPESARWDPFAIAAKASMADDGYRINGTKLFVPDAHVADYIVCAARTSGEAGDSTGITLFLLNTKMKGIRVTPLSTIAGDKQFELTLKDVVVPETAVLHRRDDGGEALQKILQYAAVCKCAEMVGGAEKVIEMAAAYAKERHQFGKPIGSFQAIQHHCANMLIDLEGSRYITYKAAWLLGNDIPCEREVAVAKAWVSGAYKRIAALGHQVQGGSAFMEEHDMPLYSRRAAAAAAFGDAGYYRKIVADSLGL